jgi:hypothetical protein
MESISSVVIFVPTIIAIAIIESYPLSISSLLKVLILSIPCFVSALKFLLVNHSNRLANLTVGLINLAFVFVAINYGDVYFWKETKKVSGPLYSCCCLYQVTMNIVLLNLSKPGYTSKKSTLTAKDDTVEEERTNLL